jgi:rhodanese-related sulfurtransferase
LTQVTVEGGDVYLVEITRLEPPRCLEFTLRLFGISPKQTVRFDVIAAAGGCLLRVATTAPESSEFFAAGHADWMFLTERLEKVLRKSPLPAMPEARQFMLSTDLPGTSEAVRGRLAEYLDKTFGLSCDPFSEECRTTLSLRDDDEPDGLSLGFRPPVRDACCVDFQLEHPSWLDPAWGRLSLRQQERGTRLTVQHSGWTGISFDSETRIRQRARLARYWHKFFMRFTLEYSRSWQIPTLTAADLNARLAAASVHVFDANRSSLWERGHVPQSVFVGQEDIPIDRLPEDKNAELVFYCRDSMCLTAYLSAAQARTLGYPNTWVMEGGRAAWAEAGFVLVAPDGTVASDQDEPEAFDTGEPSAGAAPRRAHPS